MNPEATEAITLKPPSVFGNRSFILLFSGKIISMLGDQIYAFALSWFILDFTKSSLTMSLFLVINTLVGAIISPFGGGIADRVNRKNILIWMDVIRGIVVVLAAALLYYQLIQIWMLYICAIILAICGSLFAPAASAIIPNVVEENQLSQATSMDQFVGSFCMIAGMLISGLLYNLIGITAIFLLNAVSYFSSGILEANLKIPLKVQRIKNNFSVSREFGKVLAELGEGYQYVKQNKLTLKLTLMYALFNLVVFPYALIYLPYAFNVVLKATPFQLALAIGSAFIGNMIGACLVQVFSGRYKLKTSIAWGLFIWSFCILVITGLLFLHLVKGRFTIWEFTLIGSGLAVIGGTAFMFCCIPINVIFQKFTLDEYRGRFWGFQSSITALTTAAGFLIGGLLAQKVWMVFLFLSTSVALGLVDLWIANVKEVRELKDRM